MSRVAFPFATLRAAAVHATPWELHSNGRLLSPAKSVAAWDYGVDLGLRRELRINWEEAKEQLGFESRDAEFDVVVTAGTGAGAIPRARRSLWKKRLKTDTGAVEIAIVAPGGGLSGRLHVETALILARPANQRTSIAPASVGARLWRDVHDLALEGDVSRFPMEAVSFRSQFPGAGRDEALWLLHWQPSSLQSDFLGAVRLYLNTDQPEFLEKFRTGDSLVMRMVLSAIMSEMITTVLTMDDGAEALGQSDPASIAGRVASWIRLAFPGLGIPTVREKLRSRPGEFHTAIQAAARTEG